MICDDNNVKDGKKLGWDLPGGTGEHLPQATHINDNEEPSRDDDDCNDYTFLQHKRKSPGQRVNHLLRKVQGRVSAFQLATDDTQFSTQRLELHPELEWDATLRRTNDLHPSEVSYLSARRTRILNTNALRTFLSLPQEESINPDDLPIVGLGGSGGGYRSHLGFIATFQAAKVLGFWDLVSYVAGVSAACWTIAAYLTFAHQDADLLLSHFAENSSQHPLSPRALRTVLSSPHGADFLFAPLAAKVRKGLRLALMDLWSTGSTGWMWLPLACETGERPRLREEWMQWSKVWERAGVKDGCEPFPILTCVRHVIPWDPSTPRRLLRHLLRFARSDPVRRDIESAAKVHHAWYQWWEVNPLEVGSDEMEGWVPSWAFGRRFRNGRSLERAVELPLSLLLGPATSAPSAPLVDQLATVARNLPEGIVGRSLKRAAAGIMRRIPAEAERFGNKHPLHPGQVHNPFFLVPRKARLGGNEKTGRIALMDAGLDNNMPMQPFLHPGREVDVLINIDFSSDVQEDTAMARLRNFCRGRGLELRDRNPLPSLGGVPRDERGRPTTLTAEEVEKRFEGRYAQVLDAVPMWVGNTGAPPKEGWYYTDGGIGRGTILCNDKDQPQGHRSMLVVYAPLLPNKVHPEFDPSTAAFADSYNLVWTPEQVHTIAETQRANIVKAMPTIRDAIREAYETKKRQRLERERMNTYERRS
ncbi:FabD/lysophospholipase-like protein [Dacryopinax primogenitus]|uniref:Lysophospholipase n=1 Tax=Dacryopinax primogenitus (strain DJM 731) TaxID=1858805 RepID=M5FTP2_DACPD|nr:FabD/lysophospholipase-like protein [Dacryopinax primogenitus]EJT98789.1 FabD/lysophospholipase-like protein [Dacryopinax primogenitus]